MKLTINNIPAKPTVEVAQMRVGQLGRINYMGEEMILLRHYNSVVALNYPGYTWSPAQSLQVELLPPGTSITLTSEI